MFRAIFRRNSSLIFNKFQQKSIRLSSSNADVAKPEQINIVELIGTVQKHLFSQPSGYQSFIIQTVEPNNRFYYHMVGTGPTPEPVIGRRIHLVGRISSKNYWTEQKQIRQKIIIKTNKLNLLPIGDIQPDLNHVEIASQIYSDIEHKNDFSAFMLTTHHTIKGGESAGIYHSENHRILIRDPSLLEIARNELKRLDCVDVKGKITYTFSKNTKNQTRSSGYILADSLTKQSINPS